MNLRTIKQIIDSGAPDWEDRLLAEVERANNEDLNMERRTREYVVTALNRTDRYDDAAHLLGVSKRTLYRYMQQFNIGRYLDRREFYYVERIPNKPCKK